MVFYLRIEQIYLTYKKDIQKEEKELLYKNHW